MENCGSKKRAHEHTTEESEGDENKANVDLHNHHEQQQQQNQHQLGDENHQIYPNFSVEPTAVARRNERERNRVRLVNEGFSCLRQRIPFIPEKKKLSKVETLRYAVAYIKHLQCVIQEHDAKMLSHALERRRIKCGMVRVVSTRAQERWDEWTDN